MLLNPYITREAVASSSIEGTQASISDLFDATAEEGAPQGDVKEVQNYVRALTRGLDLLPELPVSQRLVREIHRVLLEGVRGRERTPGEFRQHQNWIGLSTNDRLTDAVFVPPPPDEMNVALDDWERFNHEEVEIPLLVRCALLHYQFETIHPFVDGNGRLGRLLIVFFLVEKGLLPQPLLYLSSFLEANRREYYERLQAVRERGELEEWIRFFLRAVEVQAKDAVERAERLIDLREQYRTQLTGTRSRAPEVVELLFENPILTAPFTAHRLGITHQGALKLLRQLTTRGIVREAARSTGPRKRWIADGVIRALVA
jgi:Fic family protein